MALVAGQVRVAGTGEVYVAPVGTMPPADSTEALSATWKGLGYNTDDGLTITRSMEVEDILAWQTLTPVRRVPTSQEFTVGATFLQSNPDVVSLFHGTTAFSEPDGVGNPGEFKATASIAPEIVERAVVVEFKDGSVSYRIHVPKAQITADGDQEINRSNAAGYPMTFSALAPDTGSDLYEILTNDPNVDPGV